MKNYVYVSPSFDGWENLARDEAFLHTLAPGELILYLYRNQKAVIIGRNQNAWKECHTAAMEGDGVQLVRRFSGGGAVYHDLGNLNFSFVAGADRYDLDMQLDTVLQALSSLGIRGERSGRNDLTWEGKKFSGNAFSMRGSVRSHHGTLLLRADMTRLGNYLRPSPLKLKSKGIDSVRSRVVNLEDAVPGLTAEAVTAALLQAFRDTYGPYEEYVPTPAFLEAFAGLLAKHTSWEWRMGRTPAFDWHTACRFPWGEAELALTVREGKVIQAALYTDSLDETLSPRVEQALAGCPFRREDLAAALTAAGEEDLAGHIRATLAL